MTYVTAAHAREVGALPRIVQGFVREEDRTQATGPAVAAMRRLVEAWQLSRAEAAALMGASRPRGCGFAAARRRGRCRRIS